HSSGRIGAGTTAWANSATDFAYADACGANANSTRAAVIAATTRARRPTVQPSGSTPIQPMLSVACALVREPVEVRWVAAPRIRWHPVGRRWTGVLGNYGALLLAAASLLVLVAVACSSAEPSPPATIVAPTTIATTVERTVTAATPVPTRTPKS